MDEVRVSDILKPSATDGKNRIHDAEAGDMPLLKRFVAACAGDSSLLDRPCGDGLVALHYARHGGVAAVLLDGGADPNVCTARGWTPLMEAVWEDQRDTVLMLLDSGADVDAQDDMGRTALYYAVSQGSPAERILLNHGATVTPAVQGLLAERKAAYLHPGTG